MQKLKCFLIQYDVVWENKILNFKYLNKIISNTNPVNSAIFLPEMFNTGFSMNTEIVAEEMQGFTSTWMREISAKYNSLIAGSIAVKEDNKYYNRFLWCFPDGTCKYYDKRHLFRMVGEEHTYSKGYGRIIIEYKGFRFLPVICYDIRFPVWIRNRNEYDVIVCCANWPESRKNAWDILLKARAIENQSYVLGINRIGNDPNGKYDGSSQVIDYKGDCIETAGVNASVISYKLDSEQLQHFRDSFPVWKDMDSFNIKL